MFVKASSYTCLGLTLALAMLYATFGSDFAKIHIQPAFIDFPVFIGECVLLLCLAVMLVQARLDPEPVKLWFWGAALYFVWVAARAAEGYASEGPYALRNAAMFYYPVFGVMTVHFLRKLKQERWISWWGIAGVFFFIVAGYRSAHSMVIIITAMCCALSIPYVFVRRGFMLILTGIFLFNFKYISGGRGTLVGAVAAIMFLAWFIAHLRGCRGWKLVAVFLGMILVTGSYLWIWGDRNAEVSMLKPMEIIKVFQENDLSLQTRRSSFVPCPIKPKIYNNESDRMSIQGPVTGNEPPDRSSAAPVVAVVLSKSLSGLLAENSSGLLAFKPEPAPVQTQSHLQPQYRSLSTAYGNSVFRLFIWRDMFREYIHEWPLSGFSFGKPQRSPSIEILGWAKGEWSRDGWIMPHNSFLHYIYRGGIVGLAIIVFILGSLAVMTRIFLARGSLQGALLVSLLIYWVIIAQFGVVLEFPYYAIPFWSVFGAAFYFARQLEKKNLSV
jgi:hypothetical protein